MGKLVDCGLALDGGGFGVGSFHLSSLLMRGSCSISFAPAAISSSSARERWVMSLVSTSSLVWLLFRSGITLLSNMPKTRACVGVHSLSCITTSLATTICSVTNSAIMPRISEVSRGDKPRGA